MTEQPIRNESKQRLFFFVTCIFMLLAGFMVGRVTADRYELTVVPTSSGSSSRYLVDKATGALYRPSEAGEWVKSASFP